ncbi:hypothetical protein [Janibacter anophelis]|uniref:HD domain-containing protein n=1 Tax=Janibacter anophelis TaxID=319054 RepID=UPI0013B04C19|nr:hypothetical protein [Janibacter anophelis]
MDTLRSRWHADVIALCPDADRGRVAAEATDLLDRWLEDHRSYHDVVHLAEVLAALDELHEGGDLPAHDRHLAGLVAWYHDAVYEPEATPGGNEEASARLAQERLARLGVAPDDIAVVARLVSESASHEMSGDDAVTRAFHDADLWVLSAPTERFDAYCHQVRLEYGLYGDADYARGRTAALTPFAQRDRLYLTEHAQHRWSGRARVNLRRELDRLNDGP